MNVIYPSKFFRIGFFLIAAAGAFGWYILASDPMPPGNTVEPVGYASQLFFNLCAGTTLFFGLAGVLISNSLFKVPVNYVAFHRSGSIYNGGWKFLPFAGIVGHMSVASPSQRVITLNDQVVRLRNGTELQINASIAWKPDQQNLTPFINADERAISEAVSAMIRANLYKTVGNYTGTWRDLRAEQTTIERGLRTYDDTPRQFGVVIEYVKLTKIEALGKAAREPEAVDLPDKFQHIRNKLRQLKELRQQAEADGSSEEEIDVLDRMIDAEKTKLMESL